MAFGDLTTLGEVKAWLQTGQAAFPDTDDALLGRLITAATQFIQKWLNRNIALADWYEVREITSVKVVEKRVSEEVALVRPPWVEVWLDRRRSMAV